MKKPKGGTNFPTPSSMHTTTRLTWRSLSRAIALVLNAQIALFFLRTACAVLPSLLSIHVGRPFPSSIHTFCKSTWKDGDFSSNQTKPLTGIRTINQSIDRLTETKKRGQVCTCIPCILLTSPWLRAYGWVGFSPLASGIAPNYNRPLVAFKRRGVALK